MTPDQIFDEFVDDFARRKFVGGLLVALIDFVLELEVPDSGVSSFEDLLEEFPRQERTRAGDRANTLIVQQEDGSTLSIRPAYNRAERLFKAEHHRYDYPSCAPHATQAWDDYVRWIDSLCAFSKEQLTDLRQRVIDYVLEELPDHEFQPGSIEVEPPAFRLILDEFEFSSPDGEPTGAAYQGAAFGFIRADNPHLQVEIDKVRTGSSRRQRVGDIDAWDGERLAVTAEVKAYTLTAGDIDDLSDFAHEVNRREAIGLVVAFGFEEEAREQLLESGVKPLSIEDLVGIVDLWDPAKQRIATKSFVYYAHHVEQNNVLITRVDEFLEEIEEPTPAASTEPAAEEEPAAGPVEEKS